MSRVEKLINWDKIISLYNTIKSLYALCEETDPELKTNLQPLNEFRAALDHMMRIAGIEKTSEYKSKSAFDEATKLRSHLRRALFDICDMLTINYRIKIVDTLQEYTVDEINQAIPSYYSTIRPRVEEVSEVISALRTEKRYNSIKDEETAVEEYPLVVEELQGYYKIINSALPSLVEIRNKNIREEKKKERDALIWQKIVPAAGIFIGIIIAIIGWVID